MTITLSDILLMLVIIPIAVLAIIWTWEAIKGKGNDDD